MKSARVLAFMLAAAFVFSGSASYFSVRPKDQPPPKEKEPSANKVPDFKLQQPKFGGGTQVQSSINPITSAKLPEMQMKTTAAQTHLQMNAGQVRSSTPAPAFQMQTTPIKSQIQTAATPLKPTKMFDDSELKINIEKKK